MVWDVGPHGPVSGNDPYPGGPDGASGHSYRPPGYAPSVGPAQCAATRPVPRVLKQGRVVVPMSSDVEQPWSRMDVVVDVLRKRPDLSAPGPPPAWLLRPEGRGWDTWVYDLECPIDWSWLVAHAQLPNDVRHDVDDDGVPFVACDYYVIRGAHRADDPHWIEAGWRQGEPFDGALPPRAESDAWLPRSERLWAAEERRRHAERRRAAGKRWWQH